MKNTSSTTNLIATAVIISAVTAGFATGPAFGQQPGEAFKFHFNYSPAELTSAPAAEKLLVRLENDVRAYCRGTGKISLDQRAQVEACVDATLRESIAKFGGGMVAQAFQTRADG